ncbi:hypothetical protein BD324DRAFT_634403 [Kockovaella imperatae]|uniref:Uncharacterized protein n=1 Tax=Kockovaella imperatae TaxID=4999 RepID=A0A1Y1U9F7_9TREE|nr:hypothetical protein BD324DRAFT_634403 [Kockovaella imperatae]ORX34663.1 hypothetical protein BD324DRAFT_634403 [Kockovaella imperatae]
MSIIERVDLDMTHVTERSRTQNRLRTSTSTPSLSSTTAAAAAAAAYNAGIDIFSSSNITTTSSSNPPSSKTLESPKRPATPSEYRSSPVRYHANAHPYAIHSSSTSILTRTNSSPSKGLDPVYYRPTRRMSSFQGVLDDGKEGASPGPEVPEKPRIKLKKSWSISSFSEEKPKEVLGKPSIPSNPKTWMPSDLSAYLNWALRSGDTGLTDDVVPLPLVQDISSWIFRHRVTGRDFLNVHSDVWSTSRPPPFMSLLLTISRRMRRCSVQGGGLKTSYHRGEASVFQEEESEGPFIAAGDEDDDDEEADFDKMSGVKRLAKVFESRAVDGSGSDAGLDDNLINIPLEPQWTGSSTTSSAAGWERWGVKRRFSGRYVSSGLESRDASSSSSVPAAVTTQCGMEKDDTADSKSPPPPYASPALDLVPRSADIFASVSESSSAIRASETSPRPSTPLSPAPELPMESDTSSSFSQSNTEAHAREQVESYATLRRRQRPTTPASSSAPFDLEHKETEFDVADESECQDKDSARRTTLRPNESQILGFHRSPPGRSLIDQIPITTAAAIDRMTPDLQDRLDEIYARIERLEQDKADSEEATTTRTIHSWNDIRATFGSMDSLEAYLLNVSRGNVGSLKVLAGAVFLTGVGLGILAGSLLSRRGR